MWKLTLVYNTHETLEGHINDENYWSWNPTFYIDFFNIVKLWWKLM